MAVKARVSQFDNGIKLIFQIKKDGMIEDIQGAEIILKFKHTSEGRTITRNCTITDASAGECEYVLTTEDLTVAGGYISEVETRFSNGSILSLDNPITLIVTPERI